MAVDILVGLIVLVQLCCLENLVVPSLGLLLLCWKFSLKVGPWSQLCFIVAMAITCMPVLPSFTVASGCFLLLRVHLVAARVH